MKTLILFTSGSSGETSNGGCLSFLYPSGFHRSAGPFHHLVLSINSCAWRPLDASSSGLSSVSICSHWSGDVRSRICWTRLATNVWKRRASLDIYPRTTLLSIQNICGILLYFSSLCRKALTFVDTTAAVSSNLGTVTGLSGVTRLRHDKTAVNFTLAVHHSQIGALAISVNARVEEAVKLNGSWLTKILRLIAARNS